MKDSKGWMFAALIVIALLVLGTEASRAKTTPISVQTTGIVLVNYSDDERLAKYYDYDNGVTCYRDRYSSESISCVH